MNTLMQATLKARQNTGRLIAVKVKNRQFQVVQIVKKEKGQCDEVALSQKGSIDSAISFLESL